MFCSEPTGQAPEFGSEPENCRVHRGQGKLWFRTKFWGPGLWVRNQTTNEFTVDKAIPRFRT
eukprot:11189250-Lingulodinium_polyedra.AAC.1